jgi:hypothetical protein
MGALPLNELGEKSLVLHCMVPGFSSSERLFFKTILHSSISYSLLFSLFAGLDHNVSEYFMNKLGLSSQFRNRW